MTIEETQIALQQAIDERDALKYDFDEYKKVFQKRFLDVEYNEPNTFVINVWLSCLGGKCYPKSHLIDGLAKTTRMLMLHHGGKL